MAAKKTFENIEANGLSEIAEPRRDNVTKDDAWQLTVRSVARRDLVLKSLRFEVFGRLVLVVESLGGWTVFYLGGEGKKAIG